MRILILGGIAEALQLARALTLTHSVIYSIAGKGRVPELPCAVRVGGFGGVDGLATFLQKQGIELLIDATHPYAAQISQNAFWAARRAGIPLWAYRRPAWRPEPGDDWRYVPDWTGVETALAAFQRPFFTIGLEPLRHVAAIPAHQHWLARCLAAASPDAPRLTLRCATGPFTLAQELALLRDYRIDVLVAKNSGGSSVEAKLKAVRQLRIPVVMLERPALPTVDREFTEVGAILEALMGDGQSHRETATNPAADTTPRAPCCRDKNP
jgi:precorrin-6A/cobalt-precorrin-6A reductase